MQTAARNDETSRERRSRMDVKTIKRLAIEKNPKNCKNQNHRAISKCKNKKEKLDPLREEQAVYSPEIQMNHIIIHNEKYNTEAKIILAFINLRNENRCKTGITTSW